MSLPSPSKSEDDPCGLVKVTRRAALLAASRATHDFSRSRTAAKTCSCCQCRRWLQMNSIPHHQHPWPCSNIPGADAPLQFAVMRCTCSSRQHVQVTGVQQAASRSRQQQLHTQPDICPLNLSTKSLGATVTGYYCGFFVEQRTMNDDVYQKSLYLPNNRLTLKHKQ